MFRARFLALLTLFVLLPMTRPIEADPFASVATTMVSCPVEQATRLKNFDPLRTEVFFQVPGFDQKVTVIGERFPLPPDEFDVNKIKGAMVVNPYCFDGVNQRPRSRAKDKFDPTGHAAVARRIPGNLGCFFTGATTQFAGGQKQPEGADIDILLGVQRVDPNADSDCFDVDKICLTNGNRFKVNVDWRNLSGATGSAVAFPKSDDSGLFYFFDGAGTELLLKVLDGCEFNNHYWVFYGATTNVEFSLTVVDTQTSQSRSYSNPLGQPAPAITDTQAFATCP